MNIANWLYRTALTRPNHPAVYDGDELRLRYEQLAARSAALGAWLSREHGISAGDRVALFTKNCPEYLEIMHAVWWLGAAVVPINYKLHPREAAWIIANAEARAVFVADAATQAMLSGAGVSCPVIVIDDAGYASGLQEHAPHSGSALAPPQPVQPDDVAWLFYTSGTTGRPKGVMLTHDNLLHMSLCYPFDVDQVGAQDVSLYAAPMSHGAGLYALVFVRAAAAHLVPRSRGFDPDEIITLAQHPGNLCFFAAPTMVKRLVQRAAERGYRGEGIRTIVYGGGPMYGADIDAALDAFGPRFVQIYGQGESPMTITALARDLVADREHPRWRARRDSVGTAHSCVEVRVVDEHMRPLPAGSVGEIVVRGPTVMRGYFHNPGATAATLRDGWLLTGDIGWLSEDGFLTLTDRSKDVIISGGTNIYPREVEEVLLRHPAVFEAAVIGAPEPEWGEEVVAFVVLRPDMSCDAATLEHFCREEMASFKKPRRYHFISELPKNGYGKVLKTVLRQQLLGRA